MLVPITSLGPTGLSQTVYVNPDFVVLIEHHQQGCAVMLGVGGGFKSRMTPSEMVLALCPINEQHQPTV